MAIIGISLIVASVVLLCLRPPTWLPNLFANLTQRRSSDPASRAPIEQPEDEDDEPSTEDADIQEPEENRPVNVPQPPPIIIQEPLVDIEGTQFLERDVQSQIHLTKDLESREEGDRDEETLVDEDEDEDQETPKILASAAGDESVPSLVLSERSTATEPSEDNAPKQLSPSFAVTPPPAFNIEPATSPEPSSEQDTNVTPDQIPPSVTMTPPPAFNIEPHSEQGVDAALPQIPPPQLNLVAPEQTSSPTASPPQLDFTSAPPIKTPSDLMPPPPLPKPKLPKPRTSGIPLPASSSSPARRIPSPATAGSSSPTPTRIPSPTTTAARTAKPNAPSPPAASANRIPTLSGIPRRASPTPNSRNLPLPRRGGPASSSSGLMPPPTATSIPKKPSRQVSLQPGHSPLDWARLAQQPTSDLRNLPPNTPYLRVTPTMLKQRNGRKGNDAWSVYGGKVYNITPYIAFHPGGGPELLRGAGKDATRLFAEVHPWVNYETMLQSCLIGLLVDEGEVGPSAMEEMD